MLNLFQRYAVLHQGRGKPHIRLAGRVWEQDRVGAGPAAALRLSPDDLPISQLCQKDMMFMAHDATYMRTAIKQPKLQSLHIIIKDGKTEHLFVQRIGQR